MSSVTAETVFSAADRLFEGVPYSGNAIFRSVSGTLLDENRHPLVPVTVIDNILDGTRIVKVRLRYLLSDGSRVDQAVGYTLPDGAEEPAVNQEVFFGDCWGRGIPHRPFFDRPMPPLYIMHAAIDKTREGRAETDPDIRDAVWRLG